METTRVSLIARVRNPRDQHAWSEFVNLYQPLIEACIRKMGRQFSLKEHDIDDIKQETLLKLSRVLPDFELDRNIARFRTWLFQVIYTTFTSWGRQQKRFASFGEGESGNLVDPNTTSAVMEKEWETAFRRHVAKRAMDEVRAESQPQTWTCFELTHLQGKSAPQVAEQLNLKPGTVTVNAWRILQRVREKAADYGASLTDDADTLGT